MQNLREKWRNGRVQYCFVNILSMKYMKYFPHVNKHKKTAGMEFLIIWSANTESEKEVSI